MILPNEGSVGGGMTSDPAAAENTNNSPEIFVRGTDNALWTIAILPTQTGLSQWISLGGAMTSNPSVGVNSDGRLEVFVRGADNALWHIWQTSPDGSWSQWSSLGGGLT